MHARYIYRYVYVACACCADTRVVYAHVYVYKVHGKGISGQLLLTRCVHALQVGVCCGIFHSGVINCT